MTSGRDYRWLEVCPDYRSRLQQFSCAVPQDGFSLHALRRHGKYYAEYEWEVQAVIRDFRGPDKQSQWADICVSSDSNGEECIRAFVWYGIVGGTKRDVNGNYMIGYIARSLETKACKFGDMALRHALTVLKKNYEAGGCRREDTIGARIDPKNKASQELFRRLGFKDVGTDPEARDYHRWLRFGFDGIE